jgi:ribosomal protein S18 acetylase RimI-like enzyme
MLLLRNFAYPADYAAALELWQNAGDGVRLGPSDASEEIEKKLQRDPDLFLVAELDGRLVGTVIGGFDGRRGLVYHLAVEPSLRGRGIGSQLMTELERRLKEKGCIRCYLLVTLDNTGTMEFYETRGWSRMQLATYGKYL